MKVVTLCGWRGRQIERRISLVHALQKCCAVSMLEAKEMLETFVENGKLRVEFDDSSMAEAFVTVANDLGLIVEVALE